MKNGVYILYMPPKSKSRKTRVAGKMTLKEFMYRHTPLDAPSNDFKDQMDFNDAMHIGQPLALDDLKVSPKQANLRDSVLNVNMDEMLREIDVLLQSSASSKPKLKWVDALDQLYHDFLHRSKLQSPIYLGSPSPLSNSSHNSQLRKRHRPNKTARSTRVNPWTKANNMQENHYPVQTHHHLQNPKMTKISPYRKSHGKQNTKRKRKLLTASDIERLTENKTHKSSSGTHKSSSGTSTNSKGSMHISELN